MKRDRAVPVSALLATILAVVAVPPALGQVRGDATPGAIVLPQITDVAPSVPVGPSDAQAGLVMGTALASTALMTVNVAGARAGRPNRWLGLAGLVTGGVLAAAAADAAAEDGIESPEREFYMVGVGVGIGSSITGLMTMFREPAEPTGAHLEQPHDLAGVGPAIGSSLTGLITLLRGAEEPAGEHPHATWSIAPSTKAGPGLAIKLRF